MLKILCYVCLNILVLTLPVTGKAEVFKIVSFGDSTTATRGELKIYSRILAEELSINGQKVKVINSGINGNTTTQAKKRFQKDVLDHHPDLVIIQFGINDAAVDVYEKPPATKSRVTKKKYRENLVFFVSTLISQNTKIILMTPNPCIWTKVYKDLYGKPPYDPDDPDGFNLFLREYAEIVRDVSSTEKIPLIDIYKEFKKYGELKGSSTGDLLLDGVHPNDQGHKMVADLLIKMISQAENEGE